MEQIEEIRRMYFVENLSQREISRRTGLHRDTFSKYLTEDPVEPPKYKLTKEKQHPVLGPFIPLIDNILEEDKKRHRKQRHTGKKILERLKEDGYTGGYSTLTDYLRKKKYTQREAFLPLEFELGTYAEVDWIEAEILLRGVITKAHIFVMKLRGSGGYYAIAYPFEKQEAFFDAHIKCFDFMGGVPEKIVYDNLKTAVKKILKGNTREEQEQFIALKTHYLYESGFCRPARGNEKGGVENAGKDIVKNIFVPYPEVESFEELNEYLHAECVKRLELNPKWEAEKAALKCLPFSKFNGSRYTEAKVNKYSMIHFETNRYSVPTKYVGDMVTVKVTIDTVEIILDNTVIAKHKRLLTRNQESIVLDHYLDLMLHKSRAVGNTKVYKPNMLPSVYENYRKHLIARNSKGNKEFIKILMLHRDYPLNLVTESIEIAMAYNIYGYDAILNILGQFSINNPKVVPINKNIINNIPTVTVSPPDIDKFNFLMEGGIN